MAGINLLISLSSSFCMAASVKQVQSEREVYQQKSIYFQHSLRGVLIRCYYVKKDNNG